MDVSAVKRGPDNCEWWMRMGKCGKKKLRIVKKVKRIRREIRMTKQIKKQKRKGKKAFYQAPAFKPLSYGWALNVQYALSIVGTGYSSFFSTL